MLGPTSRSLNENVESFNAAFDKWSNKQLDNVDMTRAQHTKNMSQTKAKILHVEKERAKLEVTLNTQQRAAMEKRNSIKHLQKTVYDMEGKLRVLPQTVENLKAKESVGSEEIEKKSKEVEELSSQIELQRQQLTTGIEYYSDRLGLDFEQSQGIFWLKFWLIDPENIKATYIVGLRIDVETYHYRVEHCNPSIEGMDTLLEELNLKQDFSRFVQKVRKSFVEIAISNPGTDWNTFDDFQSYQKEGKKQEGELGEISVTPGEEGTQEKTVEEDETATEADAATAPENNEDENTDDVEA